MKQMKFFNIFTLSIILYTNMLHAQVRLALGDTPKYPPHFTHFDYVNPNAPKQGTLTVPLTGSFDSLNPFTLKGEHESGIAMLTLDTLLVQSEDEAFSAYGLLADDVRLASDGLSVRFHLHPKASFHNGDAVLAKDVVYSFQTLTQDKAASPAYRFYYADVHQVRAIDERTVEFSWKQKNAEMHLILGQLPIFSHKSFPQGLAKSGNTVPIGSGPYRLKRTVGSRLSEFSRDSQYWAQNLPSRKGMFNFDTIRFQYYQDETARVEALKAGKYDILQENVARLWSRAYSDKILKKQNLIKKEFTHENDAGMQGFVLNLRKDILKNKALRQALVLSFDFETINQLLFYGLYQRSDSFFTNTELAATGQPEKDELSILLPLKNHLSEDIFSLPAVVPPKVDVRYGNRKHLIEAKNLLLKAGYRYRDGYLLDQNNQKIVLTFLTYSKSFERATAKWQRDLAKIGISLNIQVTDAALFQKKVNDFDYDITIVGYGNTLSPGNEQLNYHSCHAAKTSGSQNYTGICHPAIEKILPHFLHYQNRKELLAASRALDRILRSEYLIVPNWYSNRHRMIYRQNLRHPEILPRYYHGLSWAIQTWWQS